MDCTQFNTQSNTQNKMQSKSVYNLLNYQQLYYDQYYRDVFQTKYCHSDRRDNLYLTILGLCEFSLSIAHQRFLFDYQNVF